MMCTAIEERLSDFVAKDAMCTVIKDKTTVSEISCARKSTNLITFAKFLILDIAVLLSGFYYIQSCEI